MSTYKKAFISFFLLFAMIVPLSGCEQNFPSGVGEFIGFGDKTLECSKYIRIDQRATWFEENPIPVKISSLFSQKHVNGILGAIEYLNDLDVGLQLDASVERETSFSVDMEIGDGNIYVIYDEGHVYTQEATWRWSWEDWGSLIKDGGINGVARTLPGTVGLNGTEGATTYDYEEDLFWDSEVVEENLILKTCTHNPYHNIEFRGGIIHLLPEYDGNMQRLALHEILHVLGFGHIEDENSIMQSENKNPDKFLPLRSSEFGMLKVLYPTENKEEISIQSTEIDEEEDARCREIFG